jgi:hypothetical protein
MGIATRSASKGPSKQQRHEHDPVERVPLLYVNSQVREKGTGEEKSQNRSSASMPSRERGAFPRFRELVSSLPIHKSVKAIRVDHCI